MLKREILGASVITGVLALAIPAQAGDTNWYPQAAWEMNEHKNVNTLKDSGAGIYEGTIGDRVKTNGQYHHFPKESKQAFRPQHIDRIADADSLDPGFSDFAVVARFRWGSKRHDMNLVQKGQGNPTGGLFKMKTSVGDQPKGAVKCLFRGSTGDSQVESYGYPALNDGKWHTVKCTRTNNGTTMYVDGNFVDNNTNQPGQISNDWPITIGGNIGCAQYICNYWFGDISFVRWLRN